MSSRCHRAGNAARAWSIAQLGEALGQVFVAQDFSPQTKQDALKVTQEIEAEMGRDIKDLTWMSDADQAAGA